MCQGWLVIYYFRLAMMECTITAQYIAKRRAEVQSRFHSEAQGKLIDPSELHHMTTQISKKQAQLTNLITLPHKSISKYFLSFQPLPFNPATFSDLKHYGGPRIAINQNKLYIGTIVDGKRHGKGVIISSKGKIYQGELMLNQRNGVGVQIYQNGNFYVGNFKDSKRDGLGKMVWVNRQQDQSVSFQYFVGIWKDGEPNGLGLHSTETWKFLGTFKNGIRYGKGIQLNTTGFFEGTYINNLREGKGLLLEEGIEYYQGQFKNGQRNGYGKWKSFQTEEEYEGFFQNGMKEGIGVYHNHKNKMLSYRGLFTEDKPSGTGEFFTRKESGSPKVQRVHDDRVITELMVKRPLAKRGELQSAQFVRSNVSNQLKAKVSEKSLQKILKPPRNLSSKQRIPAPEPNLPKGARISMSSARLARLQENPEKHACTYKHCSCHKRLNQADKPKVDEGRILRLFSARKLMLKNLT